MRLVTEGRHSGLLLPCGGGRIVEYGYGEWNWYALAKDDWWRAPMTVLWPNPGTLGRRYFREAEVAAMEDSFGAGRVGSFDADRAAVERLRERLDAEFASGGAAHHSDLYRMDFVPHPSRFWFGHDCHDEVAAWLRELGCSVTMAPIRTRLAVRDRGEG